MKTLVKIKTLAAKHVNQLPWIHGFAGKELDYPWADVEILGRHDGGIITRNIKTGELQRLSVTLYIYSKTVEYVGLPYKEAIERPDLWREAYKRAYDEGNHTIEQLFLE
jgi:hypothetical protein